MKTKSWLTCLAGLFCFFVLACPVSAAVVSPTDAFYVYDGAQVLSEETEQYILKHSRELDVKTGAQIVVVTISSLEGRSLEEYATDLFRQWGIGDAEKNNGLLLFCAVEDRQFRVEVGYGLEGDLPDGKTGRMQDTYIIPLLKENQFDEGIKNGYTAFLQEVSAVYDVSITGEMPVAYEDEESDGIIVICILTSLCVCFFSRKWLLKKEKKHGKTAFWALEGVLLAVMTLVLQNLLIALFIVGFSLVFGLGFGSAGGGGVYVGGFGGGGFRGGGGHSGGFGGGGGRSGGGGSSRGF